MEIGPRASWASVVLAFGWEGGRHGAVLTSATHQERRVHFLVFRDP